MAYLNNVPIPKSEDLTKTDNDGGISLSSVTGKTYNQMILNRVRPVIDPLVRPTQNGFRENRTTVSQIAALRRLLEGIQAKNLTAVLTFIDVKKALDSVHIQKMFAILCAYEVPEKLTQAICGTYTHTFAQVCTPDGDSDLCEILASFLRGDILAPFLFIMVLDFALRRATKGRKEKLGSTLTPCKSRRVKPVMLMDRNLTDDIGLVSDTAAKAQELLTSVER